MRRRYSAEDRERFFRALDVVGGDISAASRMIGIDRGITKKWAKSAGIRGQGESVRPSDPRRRDYEKLRQLGLTRLEAAERLGVHPEAAGRWDRSGRAGYYFDMSVDAPSPSLSAIEAIIHPRFLTLVEREKIADLRRAGVSIRGVARELGRSPSTIKREIDSHSVEGSYSPYIAQRLWAGSRARPKQSKLVECSRLRDFVQGKLDVRWSPEQISHALVGEYPDDKSMRVSHETIYQALYVQARGGLKREVQHALRTGRTYRKQRSSIGRRQHRLGDDMVMISDRPAEIEDRAVPGHWEGDLIIGAHGNSAMVTLVERSTRYVMLGHLPGGRTAAEVRDVLSGLIATLPEHLRGSLTWDQGREMALHNQFSTATGMPVYFCDPHSPWQRGTNENTNGLLRQYFPKHTDLRPFGPEDLEHVAQELNGRPRKTLDWHSPAEHIRALLEAN